MEFPKGEVGSLLQDPIPRLCTSDNHTSVKHDAQCVCVCVWYGLRRERRERVVGNKE